MNRFSDVAVALSGATPEWAARTMPRMSKLPMRVAMLASECEPWAKTGGLADVVDALARALGELDGAEVETPVDVFLPRYRGVPEPASIERTLALRVPDPRAPSGISTVTVLDVPANGYRLRLVDHPAAFDRDGFYGDDAGDYPDNAWRFGLFCRTALEALRADGRPLDILHLHDWHTGAAAIQRDVRYPSDPVIDGAAILITLHNLAFHGWTPKEDLRQLGLALGDGVVPPDADGIDLLLSGIERAELVNTVSPGFAAEALTPAFGMGLDGALRAKGDRFLGILNGLDTTVWDPATDADQAAPYSREDRSGKAACRADLLTRIGFDPADDGPVIGMIGRLDPQKGFDLLAGAAPTLLKRGVRLVVQGSGHPELADPFRAIAPANPDAGGVHRALRPGDGPQDLRRRRLLRDAVALRAVRPGPDDRAPLRDPADRASDRRTRRHGHRRGRPTRARGRASVSRARRSRDCSRRATRRSACAREAGPPWEGLLDRGMAVDFDWVSGAAPRYVDAYRRAVEIRGRDVEPKRAPPDQEPLADRSPGTRRDWSAASLGHHDRRLE